MPKGQKFRMEPCIQTDKATGVDVIRLTGGNFACHHPYFLYDPWVDGDRVVFYSDRDGSDDLYILDTLNACCLQITDHESHGEYAGLLGNDILLARGHVIFRLNPESLKEEVVVDIGNGTIASPRLSRDHRKLIFQRYDANVTGSAACTVRVDGSDYVEHFALAENYCYLQFFPSDSRQATFARVSTGRPNAADEKRSRIWKVKLDDPAPEPFYVPPRGKKVTHEYWDGRGERMFFQQYTYQSLIPSAICHIAKDGRSDFRKIAESETINFCHSHISPDDKLIVADELSSLPNSIYIVDVRSGSFEELCRADTTWENQATHAHPRFDSRGASVIFASNRSGQGQIYRVYI